MKIKQMAKLIIGESVRPLVFVYAVILMATLGVFSLIAMTPGAIGGVSGLGLTPAIILFVFGIIYFYAYLKTGFSVSVSRKTVFLSILLAGVVLVAASSVVALLLSWLTAFLYQGPDEAMAVISLGYVMENEATSAVYPIGGHMEVISQFPAFAREANPLMLVLATVIYFPVMAFTGFAAGCFVGGLYYRMGAATKIAVSVGGGLLLFVVLPSVLVSEPGTWVYSMVAWLIAIGDFCALSPYNTVLVSAACTLIFVAFFWLLIRRAPVKE